METIKTLMTRRSIRAWKQDPVSEEQRKTILEAAMNAPSAADARPWHFVTMDDPAVIRRFTGLGGTEMLENSTFMVLVCGEVAREIYPGFYGGGDGSSAGGAGFGGAIFAMNGTVTLIDVSFSGNTVTPGTGTGTNDGSANATDVFICATTKILSAVLLSTPAAQPLPPKSSAPLAATAR